MNKLISFFLLLFFVACNGPGTPESALKGFVNLSFKGSKDKTDYLARLTGPLLAKYSSMGQEEFNKLLIGEGFKKNSFKILIKNCEEQKCFITYVIKYNQKGQNSSYDIDTKKVAELVNEDDRWKISDVNDIKTFIDSSEEIRIQN